MRKPAQRLAIVLVALLSLAGAFAAAYEMARPLGPPLDALVLVKARDGHEVQLEPTQARQIIDVMRRRASFSFGRRGTLPTGTLLIDGRTYYWRGSAIIEG